MSGSELSLLILLDMSPSATPGKLTTAFIQFFVARACLRHELTDSAFPTTHYPFPVGRQFRSFTTVHLRYNLSNCSPS